MALTPTKPSFPQALALIAAAVLALGASGCGGEDGEENGEPTVAEGETIDANELRACLQRAGAKTGDAASDAVVAPYAREATGAGGDSFVMQNPVAQVIVFPDPVDLAHAEDELAATAARVGIRANSMQADAYGNVVIVYFVSGLAPKDAVTECLGAEAPPVPGFETPLVPSQLESETTSEQ